MDLLDVFGVHTIIITPPDGYGANGPIPGTPVTVSGVWVVEKTVLVRNSSGEQVASTAQIAAPAGTVVIADETKVTLPSGRVTRIISVEQAHNHGLPLPTHIVINCE